MELHVQYLTFISMGLSGMILGTVYDMYRVIVRHWRFMKWLVPGLDLFYWIFAFAVVLFGLMWANDGDVRLYIFALLYAGWFVYKMTLQRLVVASTVAIVLFIKAVALAIYRVFDFLVLRPLNILWRLVIAIGKALDRFVRSLVLFLLRPFRPLYQWLDRKTQPTRTKYERGLQKIKQRWQGLWLSVAKWITVYFGDNRKK